MNSTSNATTTAAIPIPASMAGGGFVFSIRHGASNNPIFAVQPVCRQERRRRNAGKNVSGKLGAGNAKKQYRNQRPDNEKNRQPVCICAGGFLADAFDSFPYCVHDCADDEYGPGNCRHQENRKVIPERLGVLVLVSAEAFQIVLEEKFAEELPDLDLHRNEPGKRNGKV